YFTKSSLGGTRAETKPEIEAALDLLPDELMPPSILRLSTPTIEPRPAPQWTLISFCLLPLYGMNRAFDCCTAPVGPLGRWLRHPLGRNLLGIVGLGLIGVALAWVIKDWLGWTW